MLSYLILLPLLIAIFLFLFYTASVGKPLAILAQIAMVYLSVYFFLQARLSPVYEAIGDFSPVHLGINLIMDNVSGAFVVLTTFIFLALSVFSYHEKQSKLFWLLMYIWQSVVISLFLTRDFFNIFVLMEVSTVVIVIMIMYNRHSRSMYDGIMYLMANIISVQFFLFGMAYMYMLTGTLDVDVMAQRAAYIDPDQLVLPFALMIAGMGFKATLVPFGSWLPKVRAIPRAPAPVAALLSAMQAKGILFVIMHIHAVFPMLGLEPYFIAIGVITALGGIAMALGQKDIKLMLAYSSIAQVGLIVVGLNLGGTYSFIGSLYHMINHVLFKVALFLGASMVIEVYGTRDITKISGLFKKNPLLAVLNIVPVVSIMGAPLFNGSMSKYFLMAHLGTGDPLFWVISLINLGTILVFVRYSTMFFGAIPAGTFNVPMPFTKTSTLLALGALCLGFGVFATDVIYLLFNEHVVLSAVGYTEKSIVFAISLAIAIVAYKQVITRTSVFANIGKIDFTLKNLALSIGIFFVIIVVIFA